MGKMSPKEHNSRRAIRFAFIGMFVVVVGVLVAIYTRELRGNLGSRRDSATASESPVVEPSLFHAADSVEIPTPADSVGGFEAPPPYEPFAPKFDFIKGKNDICPLHKVKMAANFVEVRFQFETRWFSEFEKRKNDEFPFAYTLTGDGYFSPVAPPRSGLWFFCGTGLPPPTSAKMFVCPPCLAAYESAVRVFNPKAVAIRREEEAEAVRRAQPIGRNLK
jgi:hypothetical protein